MTATVAVLYLGRKQGMGEVRRVGSLQSIFEAAGARVVAVPLLGDHGVRMARPPAPSQAGAVVRGHAMAETLAWSLPSVREALRALAPDAVVSVTGRAFHPTLTASAPVFILDYVDRLATSYRDRAAVEQAWGKRTLYRALVRTSARFEARPRPAVRRVAAGWNDAGLLEAEWLPNVVTVPPEPSTAPTPDHDVLFFGNLSYPPNVSALHQLSDLWPDVRARRPETSVLVAGANPTPEVLGIARAHDWDVEGPFDDVVTLCRRARVAVAPLVHTAGIQNKVLEAASAGVAQVATPQAVAGFRPGLPIRVAEPGRAFVDALVDLLEDAPTRTREAEEARAHVSAEYVPEAWAEWAESALVGRRHH